MPQLPCLRTEEHPAAPGQWVAIVLRPNPLTGTYAASTPHTASLLAAISAVSQTKGYGGDVPCFIPVALVAAAAQLLATMSEASDSSTTSAPPEAHIHSLMALSKPPQ